MRFCNINAWSGTGLKHNEDALFTAEGLLIVADGASGLDGIHLTEAPTDACWLAQRAVALLADKLTEKKKPITEALEETALALRQELYACGYPKDACCFPSASLMIARRGEQMLELYSLGDCTALVDFGDKRPVLCWHDDAVTRLDDAVLARAQALAQEKKSTVADELPGLRALLVENRKKRNSENGYWIFDPSGEGIAHGRHMLLPAEEVRSLALMSDGFYDIVQIGRSYSHSGLLTKLASTPAQQLVEELFAALEADPHYEDLPRFKLRDDATVAYACVEATGS